MERITVNGWSNVIVAWALQDQWDDEYLGEMVARAAAADAGHPIAREAMENMVASRRREALRKHRVN